MFCVVQATAGTQVVLLGMDFDEARARDLLGFSIERTNHATGETYWVWNDILFPSYDAIAKAARDAGQTPDPALFGSDQNPFQEFLRGDYTVSPGTAYTYRVVAQGGTPDHLVPLAEASVDVMTETVDHGDGHAVWFNRARFTPNPTGQPTRRRETHTAQGPSRFRTRAASRAVGAVTRWRRPEQESCARTKAKVPVPRPPSH